MDIGKKETQDFFKTQLVDFTYNSFPLPRCPPVWKKTVGILSRRKKLSCWWTTLWRLLSPSRRKRDHLPPSAVQIKADSQARSLPASPPRVCGFAYPRDRTPAFYTTVSSGFRYHIRFHPSSLLFPINCSPWTLKLFLRKENISFQEIHVAYDYPFQPQLVSQVSAHANSSH